METDFNDRELEYLYYALTAYYARLKADFEKYVNDVSYDIDDIDCVADGITETRQLLNKIWTRSEHVRKTCPDASGETQARTQQGLSM